MKKQLVSFFVSFIAAGLFTACQAPTKRIAAAAPKTAEQQLAGPSVLEEKSSAQAAALTAAKEALDPASRESVQTPSQAPAPDLSSSGTALRLVRVLLAENITSASVKHSGRIYIYTQDLRKKFKISAPGTLTLRALKSGQIQAGSLQAVQPIIIEPAKDTTLTWDNNVYTGKLIIWPERKKFSLIEYADLETYLYGVLPYEMSHTWPLEALKAQAVAARTYTLKTLETTQHKPFDVYSDVRSQMYKGGGTQYESVRTAVDSTKNKVLTYEGKLFHTFYHGNCGGATDSVSIWNPSVKAIKPLDGASCGYDTHSKTYQWHMEIPREKIENYAQQSGLSGKLKNIKVARKTRTGRATNITLQTSKGSKTMPCNPFRLAAGLRSCKITKIHLQKRSVIFEGHGYGHGIGMCQDGAKGMALAGHSYEKILKHYYPGSKLVSLTK